MRTLLDGGPSGRGAPSDQEVNESKEIFSELTEKPRNPKNSGGHEIGAD
jgi:hypothetical protein